MENDAKLLRRPVSDIFEKKREENELRVKEENERYDRIMTWDGGDTIICTPPGWECKPRKMEKLDKETL